MAFLRSLVRLRCVPRALSLPVLRSLCGGAGALLCAGMLSGCQAVSTSVTPVSQLRIIDASPDAGGIDIYAGNSALAYNLGFGTVTSYVPITPSTYTLTVDTAGTRTALSTTRATLANSKQYTMLVSNVAAQQQAQVLTDQSMPAPSGEIALRFLDESMSVGSVDLYLVPSGSTLAKVNPILTNVTFTQNTGYINVPTGTYTLYIVANGTVISTTTVPLYTGPAVTYAGGSARTMVLLDEQIITSPALQVITIPDYDSATATQPTS
jgi:hypothetical protein